jgi:hypothetical protein
MRGTATAAEVLRLDALENIAKIGDGDDRYYLFKLDDLLPEGQWLTINMGGITRIRRDNSVLAEIQLDEREIYLVSALALSYPYAITAYQTLAFYEGQGVVEAQEKLETARQQERQKQVMQPVHEYITTCSRKLMSLGIEIHTIDQEEYQLQPGQREFAGLNG